MILISWLLTLLLFTLHTHAADPPFLFPHGYFDSAKLKPFDAIYLNLMAQSNLEYGGVTLEDLDQLDRSRKLVARPPHLPRTREEDDIYLDREPLPLDTDAIAPGPKEPQEAKRPTSSSTVNDFSSFGGGSGGGRIKVNTAELPSHLTVGKAGAELAMSQAKPILRSDLSRNLKEPRPKSPPSPFSRIRLLRRRNRRDVADEGNPFEEIATRAPPRDQEQLQRVRYYIRRNRRPKKKRRRNFLTRNDIYDPQRNERSRMTKEEIRKLREELALKTSDKSEDFSKVEPQEALEERPTLRPSHTGEVLRGDLRTTSEPHLLPTLISTVDHLPRLRNNPYQSIDISKPTVISLPIPPPIEEAFEGRH